jgi:hypothetical protein
MSRWLQISPGSRPEPPGLERRILRRLPMLLVVGTVLPILAAVAMRWWPAVDEAAAASPRLQMIDALAAAIVVFHWTALFTVAIACTIVVVMKGPEYVADAYPLPDRDQPGRD